MTAATVRSAPRLAQVIWWLALLATVMGGRNSLAATFYVDGDAPINGIGTETSPFNSLPVLQAALGASSHVGVTVYFAGTFRGQRLFMEPTMTDCSYRQWPGKPQTVVRGDVAIEGTWTEAVPGLRYSMPLYPSNGIESVVEDWDVRIDSQGRHYGHMFKVNSAAAVENIEGSWFYDGTLLHIHASNDENPNTSGRTYARCISKSGWFLGNHKNCVVDGIHFLLWVDPDLGDGYAIFMGKAIDCTIRNCVSIDYGFHGFGFVGTACTGNTFDRCVTRGGRDNGSTGYVFFTETGTLHSCQALDCEAHLHHLLDVFGQPLFGSMGWSTGGFYAHTGGVGQITDLELHRCTAYGYEITGGFGFGAAYNVATPSDPEDPESYAIRIYDSSLVDGVHNGFGSGTRVAFVRCNLDLTRMAEILPPSFTGINSQANTWALFESCTIAFNTDGLPGGSGFRIGSNVQYLLRGCTVYDDGITSPQRSFFRFVAPTSVADVSQTVFVHRTPQHLSVANSGVVVSASNQRFDHCWYDGIKPANGYSPNPAFDSLPEFAASIDPDGIFDVDPQFVAAPDDLEGMETGPLHTTIELLPGVDRLGINQQEYSGHYGAHQYGLAHSCPADVNVDGDVNGFDLALLLGSWGPVRPGTPGDMDNNGVIAGHDLAILLAAWGPCR